MRTPIIGFLFLRKSFVMNNLFNVYAGNKSNLFGITKKRMHKFLN